MLDNLFQDKPEATVEQYQIADVFEELVGDNSYYHFEQADDADVYVEYQSCPGFHKISPKYFEVAGQQTGFEAWYVRETIVNFFSEYRRQK